MSRNWKVIIQMKLVEALAAPDFTVDQLKMTTEFEIIMSHVKEGGVADCLGQPNTRCLTGLQKNVWMIQGPEGLPAYYDLTKRIYKPQKIQNNYTIKHVEKVLDTLILEAIQQNTVSQKNIVSKARQQLPAKKLETFVMLLKAD